jgi:hypothetical protein
MAIALGTTGETFIHISTGGSNRPELGPAFQCQAGGAMAVTWSTPSEMTRTNRDGLSVRPIGSSVLGLIARQGEAMISNLQLFLQRVLEQALAKSPNLSASLINPDTNAREAYMAEVVGTGLAAIFEKEGSSEAGQGAVPARDLSSDLATHYEELLERNAAMASALGACECWGEVGNCEICLGAGKPGWVMPDRRLFSTLIGPALRVLKETSRDRVTGSKNRGSIR